MCSWGYLSKNNQVWQFMKFMISSTSRTHVQHFPRPVYIWKNTIRKELCLLHEQGKVKKFKNEKSNTITRNSRPEVFCKKGVLKNFVKFTEKHLCQSLFFNTVADLRPATLLQKRPWHRCFSFEFCQISNNTFFHRTPLVAASELHTGDLYFMKPSFLMSRHLIS